MEVIVNTIISQANRLFISYAFSDDELFDDAVRAFANDLKRFYSAKTGNELSVFFARESIGWGDNWRSRIDSELENASIFMPIITMQYFNRSACRDELNTFHQGALRLGVQYLILPVVIAGAHAIRSDHPMPEVATIKALQYKNLEETFLAGPGTPEWRRALSGLTDELIELISRGELASPVLASKDSGGVDQGELSEDNSDFLTSAAELETLTPALAKAAEQVLEDFGSWSEVVNEATKLVKPGLTVQQMRAVSISIANQLKIPSEKLHDSGVKLAETAEKADAVMNAISDQISRVPTQEGKAGLEKLVAPMRQSADLHEVVGNMTELLENMASVEVLSAPLRRSLKPARIGITKIQDTARVVDRWANGPHM
ncbi:toll/interleukin-1 receptor domain-containing protein [Streptomyces sp. R44]|uniref:Toll/interleukin-1 receptor domain-containing protein n=1 Tax=Streptomyces sp. R44 TaxID=3238633 RepID=A0AB39SSX2_9ACTN